MGYLGSPILRRLVGSLFSDWQNRKTMVSTGFCKFLMPQVLGLISLRYMQTHRHHKSRRRSVEGVNEDAGAEVGEE